MDEDRKPSVAILTFTDAREEGISSDAVETVPAREAGGTGPHLERRRGGGDRRPAGPARRRNPKWYGLRSLREIDAVVRGLQAREVDAVVIGAWTWSPPMFIKEFIRKFPRPLAYYTENDPMSGNLSQLAATCSSLMDWSVNDFARRHERIFGDRQALLAWVRGAAAASRMRESAADAVGRKLRRQDGPAPGRLHQAEELPGARRPAGRPVHPGQQGRAHPLGPAAAHPRPSSTGCGPWACASPATRRWSPTRRWKNRPPSCWPPVTAWRNWLTRTSAGFRSSASTRSTRSTA